MNRTDFPDESQTLLARYLDEVRSIHPEIIENTSPKAYLGLDFPHSVVRGKLVCGFYRTQSGFSVAIWVSPAGRGGHGDRWPAREIRSAGDWKPLLPLMRARVEYLRTGILPGAPSLSSHART